MKKIPCPVSSDELRLLFHRSRLTDKEVAARLPGGTVSRVRSWRREFGVEALPRWTRNDVTSIEGRLHSLLVGSMLGDGRVVHRTHASYYTESHSGAQREYLAWKAKLWGSWAKPLVDVPDKRGYEQVRFRTCAHGNLNPWRDLFYDSRKRGWKRLIPDVVDMVDEFALAIWYLDDGCAAWWPLITFGMDEASRDVAWAIFEKFGLEPRWETKKGNTGHFHMEREWTAERFLDLIEPHVPVCMKHKLGPFGFQGSHYQVRCRLDPEVLEEMAEESIPIKRIARELGVGASTVSRRLKEWGIDHPRKKGRPRI
jgi:hypothetical protein